MSLSNKALLVNLSISQCAFRRIDKQATSTVEVNHKTTGKVGNYTKKLIFGKELDEVGNLAQNIRKWFYEQTLPWLTDGSRILKSNNFFDFTEAWRQKENEFNTAKTALFNAYPRLIAEAEAKLGPDLFNPSEYPSVASLENMFNCSVAFVPFPDVSDFRVELSDFEKKSFLDSMRKVENEALQECWTRLKEVVSKASDKLNDPTAIFRDSLISNVQEMCNLLPKLNVTDDPELETMRRDVERLVIGISPERCRENVTARSEAAQKLAEITSKMSWFMNG